MVMERARAMMNHAGFTMAKRQQLWCEAAQTTTLLDNILVQDSAKSPPFIQFFGVDAKYAKHLRVFGEICVVADTEVWHMAHFWVPYGRCTMPGSPMGRSEGFSRRWAG